VAIDGHQVAVFNVAGTFHATSNICTHQFALLSEGYLDGCIIECPLHQGRFDVRTGAAEGDPVTEPIKVYPIKVADGAVLLELD
jgi:nitrite reductase/ring-hydroxylating ferredoxin subunit